MQIKKTIALLSAVTLAACTSPALTNPTLTLLPAGTNTPKLSPTQTLKVSPTASVAPTQTINYQCPEEATSESQNILQGGSLLFKYAGFVRPPGIWSVSPASSAPLQIYDGDAGPGPYLSPDRTTLAWYSYPDREPILNIFDLVTASRIAYELVEPWRIVDGWTQDNRVILLVEEQKESGVGQKRQLLYFDPQTQGVETVYEEIDLPGYTFSDRNFQLGPTSLDPSGEFIVYTSVHVGEGAEVVLRDLRNRKDVWRISLDSYLMPIPQWDREGSRVAMALYSQEEEYEKIYSLTTNGSFQALTNRSLDQWGNYAIRYMSWSPNSRYLHYSLWQTGSEGPGFILDTVTLEIRSICDQDSSTVFVNGEWVGDSNLLAYTVRLSSGISELRVLDVENWQVQRLADTSNSEVQIRIVGWTPLEIP